MSRALICILTPVFAFVAGCTSVEFEPVAGAATGGAAGAGSGTVNARRGGTKADVPEETGGNGGGGGAGQPGKPNGAGCTADGECGSGNCADEVCCESECAGSCESCNLPESPGVCSPHPQGTDPEGACLGNASAPTDPCAGSCDGFGECQAPGPETTCTQSSCSSGTQVVGRCDGSGGCSETETSCWPYACGNETCNTACAGDSECAGGQVCKGGACVAA